nr:NAD(P)H-binding protein [Angustibacter aerolatus]
MLRPDGLTEALAGAEVVVDLVQSPSLDGPDATRFFTTAAENVGRAATAAGVTRTVVLSIIGVDRVVAEAAGTGFDGYYGAKARAGAHRPRARSGRPGGALGAVPRHGPAGPGLGARRRRPGHLAGTGAAHPADRRARARAACCSRSPRAPPRRPRGGRPPRRAPAAAVRGVRGDPR